LGWAINVIMLHCQYQRIFVVNLIISHLHIYCVFDKKNKGVPFFFFSFFFF